MQWRKGNHYFIKIIILQILQYLTLRHLLGFRISHDPVWFCGLPNAEHWTGLASPMHFWIWRIKTTARNRCCHCSCPIVLESNWMLACIRTPIWNDHWQTCQTTGQGIQEPYQCDWMSHNSLDWSFTFIWWSVGFHLLAALALVQAQAQEKHKAWQASHSAAYLLLTRFFAHKPVSS